jgi:hypothetical protein
MTTFTKDNGFGSAETPAHPARSATDNGGRTTFSQRIAWRNGNSNDTVVTPAGMETATPVTPAATVATEAASFRTSGTDTDDDDQMINPYDSILQDAAKWKRQLESARDEIYFLQVQNAMHLDYLTMAGAEE